ncbi:MAG: hypothetical protein K9M57_03240 [Phycisphaerae bacterium]|nr:hypothetical protein [Phycisphaerae bacterium]
MAQATFHHFGVPTTITQSDEVYLEGIKVHLTDPENHPYRIEFLRFESGSPMHAAIQNNAHAAYMVEDLQAALEGKNVIVEPFDATEALRVAFITDGDAVIELMQKIG